MSDKKLLNENTIRRFMTLANVQGLTDNFIIEKMDSSDDKDEPMEEGMYMDEDEELEEGMYMDEDEEMEEGMYSMEEDDMLEEQEEEEEEEEEAGMTDPDAPMSVPADDAEMGEADISLTEEEAELLISLGERLKEAMEAEGAAPEMDAPPADAMADADVDIEDDAGMGDEEEEEIVQEILRRVTRRLVRERK